MAATSTETFWSAFRTCVRPTVFCMYVRSAATLPTYWQILFRLLFPVCSKIVPICGTKLRVHDFRAVQLCNDKRYRKGSVNPLRRFSRLFDSQSGLKYCSWSWGFRSDEKNEYDYSDRLLLFSHFTKLTLIWVHAVQAILHSSWSCVACSTANGIP